MHSMRDAAENKIMCSVTGQGAMSNFMISNVAEDAVGEVARSASDTTPSPPKAILKGWRLAVVQLILLLGLLLSMMESSIIATALVTIGLEFNDFTTATWVILGYLLSYMGLATVFTRFSDVIGRKWALIFAWAIFTIFSLGCGLARSLPQLIAFRVFQGIGGSGLYSLTFVTVAEVSPPELFTLMSGCIGAVFAIAGVLGPILGGVITHYSSWRWIFLLNCPFGVLAIFLVLLTWPKNIRSTLVHKVRLVHIDWIGAILLVAASVLLIFGLQEAGATAAWGSATSIATLTSGGLCWLLLACWIFYMHRLHVNGKTEAEAIFPLSVVKRGKLPIIIITTTLAGWPFFVTLIYLPEHFQIVQLNSSVEAGVHILPMLCTIALGSAVGSGASMKRNNAVWTLASGSALLLLGCGLLSTATNGFQVPHREYGYQVIIGFGLGLVFATVTVMSLLEARVRDMAVAQGLISQVRIFGGSIGLAVCTIIFNNKARQNLAGILTPDELTQLQRDPIYAYSLPIDKQLAVRDVFAESFNSQMRLCSYISAACLFFSLFAFSKNPPQVHERKAFIEAVLDGRANEDQN